MNMLLTALTLDESPRLRWRKILTEYFRVTGDWSVYSLSPCIIVGEGDVFSTSFSIGNGSITFAPSPCWNGRFMVLPAEKPCLLTPDLDPGLFISCRKELTGYDFPRFHATIDGVALIEKEAGSFRILRSRHLRKDRD